MGVPLMRSTEMSDRVRRLLEEHSVKLDQGVVPVEVYNDPEIHQLELERIFARSWIFVAHESEIPNPGDYVTRRIGKDPFIVARDEHGEVRVLLNLCRHRGTEVCRAEKGNTSHFRCPYHNWIYNNKGEWIGAPQKSRAYKEINFDDWGLLAAPHVDSYQGLIFACLDSDAKPLPEYLGDMRFYLDATLGLHPGGMQVIGEPQRVRIPANWKTACENLTAGDNYHAPQLHRFDAEVGIQALLRGQEDLTRLFVTKEGHSGICSLPFVENTIWGYPHELTDWFQLNRLSDLQQRWVKEWPAIIFGVLPNLHILRTAEKIDPGNPDLPYYPFTRLGLVNPVGPGELEFWSWFLVWKDVPEKYKDLSVRGGILTFGTSGTYEQDDTYAWEGAAVAGSSVFARKQGMELNFQLGVGGMSDSPFVSKEEWPFPGRAVKGGLNEHNQRALHRWWLDRMLDAG